MAYPTTEQLAERLRVPATDPSLRWIAAAAQAFIDAQPTSTDFPDAIRDECFLRMAGYLLDAPEAAASTGYSLPFRNSGAAALMGPWLVRHAGVIGSADASAASSTPSAGGLSEAEVNALIEAYLMANPQSGGAGLSETQVRALIADFAEAGNTSLIPSPKYGAPTSTARGAPYAMTNAVVDNDAHSGSTLFAWARSHVVRLVERIVPAWARDDSTLIPAEKLTNAPGGAGALTSTSILDATYTPPRDAAFNEHVASVAVWTAMFAATKVTFAAKTSAAHDHWAIAEFDMARFRAVTGWDGSTDGRAYVGRVNGTLNEVDKVVSFGLSRDGTDVLVWVRPEDGLHITAMKVDYWS